MMQGDRFTMIDSDKKDSIMSRAVSGFVHENKCKQRLWVASGSIGLAVSIVIALVLVAPGFATDSLNTSDNGAAGLLYTAQGGDSEFSSSSVFTFGEIPVPLGESAVPPSDGLIPLGDNAVPPSDGGGEHGRAYRVGFRYTYDGGAGESVFLRLRPIGKYANSITVNGEEVFCIQYLSYVNAAGAGDMQRLSYGGSDDYYYYPHPLRMGDTVAFLYTLYLQREISAESLDRVAFEVVQTSNSASVVRWNVVFEDGLVSPLDDSAYGAGEFHFFDVTFEAPEDISTFSE